jgi:hypothetical protein
MEYPKVKYSDTGIKYVYSLDEEKELGVSYFDTPSLLEASKVEPVTEVVIKNRK